MVFRATGRQLVARTLEAHHILQSVARARARPGLGLPRPVVGIELDVDSATRAQLLHERRERGFALRRLDDGRNGRKVEVTRLEAEPARRGDPGREAGRVVSLVELREQRRTGGRRGRETRRRVEQAAPTSLHQRPPATGALRCDHPAQLAPQSGAGQRVHERHRASPPGSPVS